MKRMFPPANPAGKTNPKDKPQRPEYHKDKGFLKIERSISLNFENLNTMIHIGDIKKHSTRDIGIKITGIRKKSFSPRFPLHNVIKIMIVNDIEYISQNFLKEDNINL